MRARVHAASAYDEAERVGQHALAWVGRGRLCQREGGPQGSAWDSV